MPPPNRVACSARHPWRTEEPFAPIALDAGDGAGRTSAHDGSDEFLARIAAALERLAPAAGAGPTGSPRRPMSGMAPVRARSRRIEAPRSTLLGHRPAEGARRPGTSPGSPRAAAHDMLLWGARGMGKSALVRSAVLAAQEASPARSRWSRSRPTRWRASPALFAALRPASGSFLVFSTTSGSRTAMRRPAALALVARRRGRGTPGQRPPGGHQQPPRDRARQMANRMTRQPARRGRRSAGARRPFRPVARLPRREQDDYLAIVAAMPRPAGWRGSEAEALEWAKRRGTRSGRIAWQFVTELAGRAGRAARALIACLNGAPGAAQLASAAACARSPRRCAPARAWRRARPRAR